MDNDDIFNKLEQITHEIDYLYQEGVIFYPSDIKTMKISINNLLGVIKDLQTMAKHQVYMGGDKIDNLIDIALESIEAFYIDRIKSATK